LEEWKRRRERRRRRLARLEREGRLADPEALASTDESAGSDDDDADDRDEDDGGGAGGRLLARGRRPAVVTKCVRTIAPNWAALEAREVRATTNSL